MNSALPDVAVIDNEHPWPGLMPFTETTSAFFHGRETETAELQRLIKRETLTTLFGQSGLGKSSLLNAGLFPRLRSEDFFPIYIRLDMADTAADFATQVKTTIISNCAEHGVDAPVSDPDETLWQYFHRQDVDFWSAKNRLLTLVLVFDQFEEIFTLGSHAESLEQRCQAFLAELADLIEDRMPATLTKAIESHPERGAQLVYSKRAYKIVFSFREDYLPEFESLRTLIRPIMQNRMRLTCMSGDQALAAILQSGGHLIETEIAEQIVRFVAAPHADRAHNELSRLDVEPALMSVVCRELNNQRLRKGQQGITADLLREGAQQRIIQDFYENNLLGVDPRVRIFIEDQLLTDAGYRDSCALEDALALPGVTREVIDTLIAQRLLRLEERSGVLRVELTHDVLTQVARASRDRRKQAEAEQAQRTTDAARRRRTKRLTLVGGGLLSLAVTLAVVFGILLGRANNERKQLIETQSFVALSRANNALEQGVPAEPYAMLAQAIRLNPDNRAAITRSVSLLTQRRHAQMQLRQSFASAAEIAWYDSDHYAIFGAQTLVWRTLGSPLMERLELQSSQDDYEDFGLARLVGHSLPSDTTLAFSASESGHSPGINKEQLRKSLPYQAEAKLLPFVSRNNILHLFDPHTKLAVGQPIQLAGEPRALVISPGRQWVAALTPNGLLRARLDGTVRTHYPLTERAPQAETLAFVTDQGTALLRAEQEVWLFRADGTAPLRMPVAADMLRASPSGALFAASLGQEIQLYDAQGAPIGKPLAHPSRVRDLTFSPDGRYLATACLDKHARLWDTQSQTLAGPPMKHHGAVLSVRFGDDAQTLATGATSGALRIWQPFRGEQLVEPMMHPDPVAEVMLQPGGTHVLALTNGQEFYVWRWRHQAQPASQAVVLDSRPTALAASADGSRLAFGTLQGTVSVLSFQNKSHPIWSRTDKNSKVAVIAFAPNGARLAVAWNTGEVQLFDGANGTALGPPLLHSQQIQTMRFSPNGKYLASASKDGFVRLWDVEKQQMLGARIAHRPGIQSLAFSPDSALLLVSEHERVLLWDAQTTQSRGELDLAADDNARIVLADFNRTGNKLLIVATARILQLTLNKNPAGQLTLDLTEASSGQELALGDFKTWTAALSPDRRYLALGGLDGRMRNVDLETLRFIGEVMHHDDAVLGLSFAANRDTLVSWSRDRSVRVWDVRSGYAIADAIDTESEPLAAQLSQNAALLAIAPAQGNGFLQTIGNPPPGVAPPWLPYLLETIGGAGFDQTGSSQRIRNRQPTFTIDSKPQGTSTAWREWARNILQQVGAAPTVENKP